MNEKVYNGKPVLLSKEFPKSGLSRGGRVVLLDVEGREYVVATIYRYGAIEDSSWDRGEYFTYVRFGKDADPIEKADKLKDAIVAFKERVALQR